MLTAVQASEVRPRIASDIGVWVLFNRYRDGNPLFIVGSRSSDRYLTVPHTKLPAILACLSLMDGTRSIPEVEGHLFKNNRIELDVSTLTNHLNGAGLTQEKSKPALGDIDRYSITAARTSIDPLLRVMGSTSLFAWLWGALCCLLIAGVVLTAVVDPAARRMDLYTIIVDRRPMVFSAWPIAVGLISIATHELSHCLVAAAFGVREGQLRIQLIYGLFPSVTLKLKGLYPLTEVKRIFVWAAGITTNLAIVCASMLILNYRSDNPLWVWVLRLNWWMAVINLIPFLPTDGYFLASTLLKEPNIRVRSWRWLAHPRSNPDQRMSALVIAYGIANVALIVANIWSRIVKIGHAHFYRPKEWLVSVAILCLTLLLVGRILKDSRRASTIL